MRPSTWFWPFTFGVRLGWFSAGVANPDPTRALARVFLLRGQGMVFSRGLSVLCGVLRRAGIWAEDLRCVGDAWILDHLETERRAGRTLGPLLFVGHSCGGRAALFAARELEKRGVVVDLVVCVDVALPPEVPGNVRRALNITRSRWRLYPAGTLRAAPGSAARIENIDLDEPVFAWWLQHLNFTDSPQVQALVLGRIFTVLDGAGTRQADAA
jgi:hypothetical protein